MYMPAIWQLLIGLKLSTLGKNFSSQHFEIFCLFFLKKGFDSSCKLSPKETICMKCQSLCSGKKNTKNINLSSAEFAQRGVKVKREYAMLMFMASYKNK